MNLKLTFALTSALLLSACSNLAPTRPTNTRTIEVRVPEGVKNTEADAAIEAEAPRTISLRRDGWYIGIYHVSSESKRSQLEGELKKRVAENPSNQVYLKADEGIEFGDVVSALDVARRVGIQSAALVVRPQGNNALHRLTVELPPMRDPNAPIEKPNPLTLDVRVTGEGIVSLNREPQGTIDEPKLANTVANVLQNRTSNMEKTVTVKGTRTSKYAIIVRVIDVVRGAGAARVVLQLDDLP
jgi:biopolymer transport protein ExbD